MPTTDTGTEGIDLVEGCDHCHTEDTSTTPPTLYYTHGTSVGAIVDGAILDTNGNVVDNPRIHDDCTTCHNTDPLYIVGSQINTAQTQHGSLLMVPGYWPGHGINPYTGEPHVPDLDQPTSCFSCHGTKPGIIHLLHDHTTTVGNTDQCNWCHVDQVGLDNGANVDPNDPMVHDGCTNCHTISQGITDLSNPERFMVGLVDPATLTRNLVGAMVKPSVLKPTVHCNDCHDIHPFQAHQRADHTNVVRSTSAIGDTCVNCHVGTPGNTGVYGPGGHPDTGFGMPVDNGTGRLANMVHDDCSSCHDVYDKVTNPSGKGHLLTVAQVEARFGRPGIVVAMPGNASYIGADGKQYNIAPNDGGGECAACHGGYFSNHSHHQTINNVVFSSSSDTSQPSVQPCDFCHNDYDVANATSVGLSTWDAILVEHDTDGVKDGSTNSCANCHMYDGSKSAPLADVQGAIAANQAHCGTCHTNKVPAVDHGGHPDTNFGWDGNCADCHGDGSATEAVVAVVHGNACVLCHVNALPTMASNVRRTGVDGDATLAVDISATCTVCHPVEGSSNPVAGFTLSFIHHESSNYTVATSCTVCHTGLHAGNHTNTVSTIAPCSACHYAAIIPDYSDRSIVF